MYMSSKSTKLLHLWNSNRCDVRIDIFERILDVHQEFCDVQSSQIVTFKLKYLEYRQFSMWQKWWKILMYINFSSKYVDADNISLRIPKNSSNGWFREDIGFTKAAQRKFEGVKKIVENCDYSWISNLHQQHLATLKCSSLRCEKHLGLKKGKIRHIWWISVKLADLPTSILGICFKFGHMSMEMLEIADESMENIYILDIQFLHQFPESIDIDQFFDSTHHFPQKDPSFRKSPV